MCRVAVVGRNFELVSRGPPKLTLEVGLAGRGQICPKEFGHSRNLARRPPKIWVNSFVLRPLASVFGGPVSRGFLLPIPAYPEPSSGNTSSTKDYLGNRSSTFCGEAVHLPVVWTRRYLLMVGSPVSLDRSRRLLSRPRVQDRVFLCD